MAKKTTQDPQSLLIKTQEQMKALLRSKKSKESMQQKQERERLLKDLIRPFFDFKTLGKTAMKNHWKKLSSPQRERFLFW
ncbi:MAG: ABC transporter substrate-binding protein, partial [Myxococcota bacterium]